MCGICGYIGIGETGLLEKMTETLIHRGPDSAGYFQADGVGLGHRRLSIIDVAGGRQPIENEDSSLLIICNGEIYNYQIIRRELIAKGHRFRTLSDSEVVLHLYEDLGPSCLERLNGMFAFAIYDKKKGELFLARDRIGIKPLYYADLNGTFLFASELKALLRYRGFEPTLDPNAIHEYLALRYVPSPHGMFHELKKFPPAHYGIVRNGKFQLYRYWDAQLFSGPFEGSYQDYLDGFAERFERSIQRHLVSEVPLGAYLSGGLDSSLIVGAMSKLVSHPIQTFSVGFDYKHDELADAAATAEYFGCNHTEVRCRASDIELLPEVVYHLDEPIGDAIVIPMYQLAREAKKSVTVILTGEGADELLGGYLFHRALLLGHRFGRLFPVWLQKKLLAPAIGLIPASLIDLAFDYPAALGERGKWKVIDFLNLLEPRQLNGAYRHLISLFDERDFETLYTDDFKQQIRTSELSPSEAAIVNSNAPFLNRVIHLQFAHWLPDDILMKQDKMSMAWGIEGRVPFLDDELIEFVLKIPPPHKIHKNQSKAILRHYGERILPGKVTKRRKMPFYVPIENYFSDTAFQSLLHDTLSDERVRSRGIIRPEAASALRASMHRGEFVFVKQVFSLMVLELWFRMAVDRRAL